LKKLLPYPLIYKFCATLLLSLVLLTTLAPLLHNHNCAHTSSHRVEFLRFKKCIICDYQAGFQQISLPEEAISTLIYTAQVRCLYVLTAIIFGPVSFTQKTFNKGPPPLSIL